MTNPYVVFTPKNCEKFNYKRFLISYNQLEKYIGQINANKCRNLHSKQKTDKLTIKFRKFGRIEIYMK